jgi:mycobactin lysine-N-oxygenase
VSAPAHLAIIGAGPKAVAIAAKAHALEDARVRDRNGELISVKVTVFEKARVGAHWTGSSGYTDGAQRLCTPAVRDLGFPYSSTYGGDLDRVMFERYSWGSYQVAKNQYAGWVNGGCKPPAHSVFAEYLTWALGQADCSPVVGEVVALNVAANKWQVQYEQSDTKVTHTQLFDGVVITGTGPARHITRTKDDARIFDGQNFWTRLDEAKAVLASISEEPAAEEPIVIIGAGGTAAAILAWIVRSGYGHLPITLLSEQAALFTRGDSLFENQLFTDDQKWERLSVEKKKEIFNRLNRGVVWTTIMDEVSKAAALDFEAVRAEQIDVAGPAEPLYVKFKGVPGGKNASMIIDASGFNDYWFRSLLSGIDHTGFDAWMKDTRVDEFLCAVPPGLMAPPLHLPNLSIAKGPGYGSLMVLGAMSDLILNRHTNPPS